MRQRRTGTKPLDICSPAPLWCGWGWASSVALLPSPCGVEGLGVIGRIVALPFGEEELGVVGRIVALAPCGVERLGVIGRIVALHPCGMEELGVSVALSPSPPVVWRGWVSSLALWVGRHRSHCRPPSCGVEGLGVIGRIVALPLWCGGVGRHRSHCRPPPLRCGGVGRHQSHCRPQPLWCGGVGRHRSRCRPPPCGVAGLVVTGGVRA